MKEIDLADTQIFGGMSEKEIRGRVMAYLNSLSIQKIERNLTSRSIVSKWLTT